MNNLLFTALIIALLYYFFYYLPSQKKLNPDPTNKPLTHTQFTQTELETRIINDEPGAIQFPSNQSVVDPEEIKKLQKDLHQKEKDEKDIENTLDQLLKGIQDLNNEL